jgi:two-component system sensor histidine kinase RegB
MDDTNARLKEISNYLLPGMDGSSASRQGLHRLLALRLLVTILALIACLIFALLDMLEVSLRLILIMTVLVSLSIGFGIWRLRQSRIITNREMATHLALDVVFLVAVLLYSGGASNPLISYLLVLLAVAATLLPQLYVNLYALGAIGIYTAFLISSLQTDQHAHHNNSFQLHLVGMWVTFVVSAILITAFVTRMASAIRSRELTLAQAREKEMRNEQLVAIGTLAAGTAHALGTPLSTMAVLLNEMAQESEESLRRDTLRDDILLLREQVTRCKDSLNSLTQFYHKAGNRGIEGTTLAHFWNDIRDYIINIHPAANITFSLPDTLGLREIKADLTLKHALINIIENAIKAASQQVSVEIDACAERQDHISVTIRDDGPGIPPEVMENMGEPFISTRKDSMGLGIFLANAAVQRGGGTIEMFNLREGGAMTLIRLPLNKKEAEA